MYFKPDYFEEEIEIRNEYKADELCKDVSPYYIHYQGEKCIVDGVNKKGAEKNYLRLYPNTIKSKLIINSVEEEFE
jgi:hypothetical protein